MVTTKRIEQQAAGPDPGLHRNQGRDSSHPGDVYNEVDRNGIHYNSDGDQKRD